MMRILEERESIQAAQDKSSQCLDKLRPERRRVRIGFQTGNVTRDVLWMRSLRIWAHFGLPPEGKSEGRRYWNVFGVGEPEGMMGIVCEINPPFEGIRRRVQGAFARDDEGQHWVVHRGFFNGHGGMTKEFFRRRYANDYVRVRDGQETNEVIVEGKLGAQGFGNDLAAFVREVDRIKRVARRPRSSPSPGRLTR